MNGADLEQLRNAYADAVVSVAYLHSLLEERRRSQNAIMSRAHEVGLLEGPHDPSSTTGPVWDDRERWRKRYVHRRTDFVDLAVQEGKKGFASRNGQPYTHLLHTDERREEIRSLTQADKYNRGREMRDRMLDEALTADA